MSRSIATILGLAVCAVLSGIAGLMRLVEVDDAWGALLIAGAALALGAMRLQLAADETTSERARAGRVLGDAVRLAWAFAGGVAVTLGSVETAAGNAVGALYLTGAAMCALGLIAAAAADRISPSRGVDGR